MNFFIGEISGATAMEYALVAGLISLAIIAALSNLAGQLANLYVQIVTAMP